MATGFEWLSMVMFFGFFVMLMTGYPVAFSFAGTAMVFGLIGLGLDAFEFSRRLFIICRCQDLFQCVEDCPQMPDR